MLFTWRFRINILELNLFALGIRKVLQNAFVSRKQKRSEQDMLGAF